jgi:hypothetical protein
MSTSVAYGDHLDNGGLLVGNNTGTVNINGAASRECLDSHGLFCSRNAQVVNGTDT